MRNVFLNCKKITNATLLLCCCCMCACENSYRQVQALSQKKVGVDRMIDITSYLSRDALVKAKLTAPLMLQTQADTPFTEFPKTLHVDFYNDSTKVESQLFAKYGKYLQNQSKVLLRDSVVVYNVKGDTLHTNELWWDQNAQVFYTDKMVNIHKQNGDIINSIGMKASQDMNNVQLYHIQPTTYLYVADSTVPQ